MRNLTALNPLLVAWCTLASLQPRLSNACIWDSDTLAEERRKSPQIADLIFGKKTARPDTNALNNRIEKLRAKPRETEPAWWSELAGAYLRLGDVKQAAEILEPLRIRFPNDYGIHANLGTAYHLLGRYAEAEREIARDLELNPEAHFGLEVYHLALLQYLSRDSDYQSRHVYIDELTFAFLEYHPPWGVVATPGLAQTNSVLDGLMLEDLNKELTNTAPDDPTYQHVLRQLAAHDPPLPYRFKWNLGTRQNFQKGVRYMAELNPSQPACFVMLGMVCLVNHDLNLAVAAFQRARDLGSPQAVVLDQKITRINDHVREAMKYRRPWTNIPALAAVLLGVALVISLAMRRRNRRLAAQSH